MCKCADGLSFICTFSFYTFENGKMEMSKMQMHIREYRALCALSGNFPCVRDGGIVGALSRFFSGKATAESPTRGTRGTPEYIKISSGTQTE